MAIKRSRVTGLRYTPTNLYLCLNITHALLQEVHVWLAFLCVSRQVRVYSTPDKLEQTDYALKVLKHTMEQYERLFQLEYPLPKQGASVVGQSW